MNIGRDGDEAVDHGQFLPPLFRLAQQQSPGPGNFKIDIENAQKFSTERTVFDQMRMGTYSVPRVETLKAARDAAIRGTKPAG